MTAIFVNPGPVNYTPPGPYIGLSEFKNAPTAVDVSNLVDGGNQAAQDAALETVIVQASSWADEICQQVLAPTVDTELASGLFVRSDGTVRVICRKWPILEVDSFSAGWTPSTLTALTAAEAADMWVEADSVLVAPVSPAGAVGIGGAGPTWGGVGSGSRVYAKWTYLNGWPNTTLALDVPTTLPATITVVSSLGIYAGTQLWIYDGANTEFVTVLSVAGNVLTLTAACRHPHTVPAAPDSISVSALPGAVKQAVILLTSCLIQTRGDRALVIQQVGGQPQEQNSKSGGATTQFQSNYDRACSMLSRYGRVGF